MTSGNFIYIHFDYKSKITTLRSIYFWLKSGLEIIILKKKSFLLWNQVTSNPF